jgi:hypothetical protein
VQPSQRQPPHWLDDVIASKLNTGDARQIADAIGRSRQLIEAVEAGLNEKPDPDMIGPGPEQVIRDKVIEAVNDAGRSG